MMEKKRVMLSLSEVVQLKKELDSRFSLYVHMHDACGGGQWFTFDQAISQEAKAWISDYFRKAGKITEFTDDTEFVVFEG